MSTVLRGGLVVTPTGAIEADLLIDGHHIAEIGAAPSDDATVLDVDGCWIGAAFVDLHTHLREPGQEHKEDIESGRRAAAAGGYSDLYAMPNTTPATDTGDRVEWMCRTEGGVRVVPVGTITEGRSGRAIANLEEMWLAGVRMFSDDGDAVVDEALLRDAMVKLKQLEDESGDGSVALLSQHAEDPAICAGGHMHQGSVSVRLGVGGLPARGEEAIVERDLRLVSETGCRYHVQHASTRGTVELIRRAKNEGLPITAEVTPHHLAFDHSKLEMLDPVFKMYPPLREPEDVEAVRAGLADGTIDVVATDHAPHTTLEKAVGFSSAPRGVIGLETAAAVVNTTMGFDAGAFFDRMAAGPRRIMHRSDSPGLVAGAPADVVVFDPSASWRVSGFRSKSSNSPWLGAELTGRVVATYVSGEEIYRREQVEA